MRFHLILTAAAASLALTSAPALAETKSSAAPAAAANTTAPKAEKKVCRRYEKPGSHASHKICLTRAQWEKLNREG
jgi:predicted transglutaminase-like cysteine proteinase